MRELIDAPVWPLASIKPQTVADWRKLREDMAENILQQLPALKKALGTSSTLLEMGGVPVRLIIPAKVLPENESRVLLHLHGGGYVLHPGEAGTPEAHLMAAHAGIKVISVDYRLAPEHPYPAALDDALTVYRELLMDYPPEKIGVFGTSTGGGMTLALPLRAKAEALPMPGAIAPGTPWSDLTRTGDTYNANEGIDNILGGYNGWLEAAAEAYANGHDMRDPMLSPVRGDVSGFPPTLLTTGTRDLFLSNTARMQRKLREAGAPVDLLTHEALPHAAYYLVPDAPETAYHFGEHAKFFNKWLK